MATRELFVRTAAVVLTLVAVAGAAQRAEAGNNQAEPSQAQEPGIEGVWTTVVTIRDCASQTPFFGFTAMDIYLRGGGMLAESSSPTPVRATGMGAWQHVRARVFTSSFYFYTYDPTGMPVGMLKVSSRISLDATGNAFTSSDTSVATDLAGNVLEQGCSTREGVRLE